MEHEAKDMRPKLQSYYVHRNDGNKIFVKEEWFFIAQGGLKEEWGREWKKVEAYSIDGAREKGETIV